MSQSTIKKRLLQEATSIKPSNIKRLGMPYDTFLQEGKELIEWAREDAEQLKNIGFSPVTLEETKILLDISQELHTDWNNMSKKINPHEAIWNKNKKEGIALGKQLLKDYKFAFRDEPHLLATLRKIKYPCKVFDIYSYLDLFVVLGRENMEPLKAIGFDAELINKAEALADNLLNSHAEMNADISSLESKQVRDQVFALLKAKLNEIRACGKYVFKTNPERLTGYNSNYIKRKNDKAQKIG